MGDKGRGWGQGDKGVGWGQWWRVWRDERVLEKEGDLGKRVRGTWAERRGNRNKRKGERWRKEEGTGGGGMGMDSWH